MTINLFEELCKSVKIPTTPNRKPFTAKYLDKMFPVDSFSILKHNAVVFKDGEKDYELKGQTIPKDGYSDGLGLRALVCSQTPHQFHQAIVTPSLRGAQWDALKFEAAYLFALDYERYYTLSKDKAAKPFVQPDELEIWGGVFESDLDQFEDENGFKEVPLPKAAFYYYNFVLKPRESKDFVKAQVEKQAWSVRACDNPDCCKHRHVHLLSGRYMHSWVFERGQPEETTIKLAPPPSLAVKLTALEVTKNTLYTAIEQSTEKLKTKLRDNGATESKRKMLPAPIPTGTPAVTSAGTEPTTPAVAGALALPFGSADSDDEEGVAPQNTTFSTAYDAAQAALKEDCFDYLVSVVRNVNNLHWRKIDKITSSKSGAQKIKTQLGEKFTNKVLPIVQRVDGCTLREVFAACDKIATGCGGSRKDVAFGYLLARLVEPVHCIHTIDGKLKIVADRYDGQSEDEGGAF